MLPVCVETGVPELLSDVALSALAKVRYVEEES